MSSPNDFDELSGALDKIVETRSKERISVFFNKLRAFLNELENDTTEAIELSAPAKPKRAYVHHKDVTTEDLKKAHEVYHRKGEAKTEEEKRIAHNKYNADYRERKRLRKLAEQELNPKTPQILYCKYCEAWTTHDTKHHPKPATDAQRKFNDMPSKPIMTPAFMPGHEKTPEEIESWKPKATNLPKNEPVKPRKNDHDLTTPRDPTFKDPWNCLMCRNAGDLCDMHHQLALEGKKPPKY